MIKGEINLDHERTRRIGLAEAVYSASKNIDQLAEILNQAAQRQTTLLLTRLSPAQFNALPSQYCSLLDYDPVSQTALVIPGHRDRKSTRLNSSHTVISYAVFCLKKKNTTIDHHLHRVA